MKLWIRIDAALRSDPNVAELASRLGIGIAEAAGCCVLTWCAIAEHCPDGDIKRLSRAALNLMSGFVPPKGRPPLNADRSEFAFADAFLDLFVSDGRVKGWHDRQGKLIERAEKERARKFRGNGAENLGNSAPTERNGTEQTENSPPPQPEIAERERHAPEWPPAVISFVAEQENPGAWMSAFVAMLKGLGAPGGKAVTVAHIEQGCIEIKQLGGEITPRRFRRVLEQITEPKGNAVRVAADDADFVRASKRLQEIASYRDPVRTQALSVEGWKIVTPKERDALKAIGTIERVLTAKPDQWGFVVRDFLKAQRGAAA